MDPNQFDCLDEKSGLRCLASTITKAYEIRRILISRDSARRSGHRMQPYGIKIRFLSGCSAVVAGVIRDDEVEGSNPFTLTNY